MALKPIYIVLPPGEMYSPLNAGAVAIVVNSMSELSTLHPHIIGSECKEPFPCGTFTAVKPFLYRFRSRSRAYAGSCKSLLRQQEAGVVEVHNRIPLFLYLYSKLKQHAFCLYLHNDPQGMKGAKTSQERQALLEKASTIYVVSEYIKRRFMEGVTVGGEKVHVLYNGINALQQDVPLAKQQQIIFVGRMIPEKGALEFAKALKEVLPNYLAWKAIFIGARQFGNTTPTTAYEKEVLEELKSLGSQIEYMNALPHKEVMQNYRVSEIAVVPSICNEAFGRTALEAMISHCALISSDRGGLKEVVGDTAMIVDPQSPASIASAIQKVILQPVMRNKLRVCAYERAVKYFDQSEIVSKHDKIRQVIMATSLKQ
ncbi:glycosyltransferase family 4 protein [Neptunomonas sp.]|uniref:glycosyltransferase family 4 protein n=1 Tax=Neptunomonas sp. TaxID=1971898 RepID=UPI0025E41D1F|nr:glycosyltransferase family 4 protein [Neptunomonas sp.]